ncbi:MAG: hypothetical protein Q9195_006296 [Heterodermia aff. obscurata]
MAAVTAPRPAATAPADDMDDLFDYNVDLDDIFRDVDTNMNVPARAANAAPPPPAGRANSVGLGIDEEIKVRKARQPIAKLDADRLLSQAGIPKLRRTAKERLRFKGKGHEYSDAARLLQFYQLWLDELYPRAKFADGLAMIEKEGHKKRLQTMRREWINEGKPHINRHEDRDEDAQSPGANRITDENDIGESTLPSRTARTETPPPVEDADDDLYSATPQAILEERRRKRSAAAEESLFISGDEGGAADPPSEDELDALLAENSLQDLGPSAVNAERPRPENKQKLVEDNFDDEEEAMAGMDDMW